MAGRLRYFLYRDDAIVSQFLEQLEGGRYDEERIRQQASGGFTVGAGIKAGPATAGAHKDRRSGSESELSLQQTGASRFTRFYDLVAEQDAVQQLDACDDEIWDQLSTGEVLDLGVSVSIPEIIKTLGAVSHISSLMPTLKVIGAMEGADGSPVIDPGEMATVSKQLPIMEETAKAVEQAGLPLFASLSGDKRYKMFLRLKRADIVVQDLHELEGEVRMIGTIQSKVSKGKSAEVGQLLPGVPTMNRAQRRKGGGSTDQNGVVLRYPAAVITPIAIFR